MVLCINKSKIVVTTKTVYYDYCYNGNIHSKGDNQRWLPFHLIIYKELLNCIELCSDRNLTIYVQDK